MPLIITDLNETEILKISDTFSDSTVIKDFGSIKPCVGCFGCWNKTPGKCVLRDGYENMGKMIHDADEVIVISKYTYGGFSGFVKNVFDRSLGYVLPHFEIINGESHHKKRYSEDKAFSFVFYGQNISNEQQENARRYVKAVCTNIRGWVKDIQFLPSEHNGEYPVCTGDIQSGRTVILNASMRSKSGNSQKLALSLLKITDRIEDVISIVPFIGHYERLMESFSDVSDLILCAPLYVDSLPSQLIRLMETFEKQYKGSPKRIYVLANMGLYEPDQLVNLFSSVKEWCDIMGFTYCGGVGIGAGELVGGLLEFIKFGQWPLRSIGNAIKKLADTVNTNGLMEDLYVGTTGFPRPLYLSIANSGWRRMAKKNGISNEDLFRRL